MNSLPALCISFGMVIASTSLAQVGLNSRIAWSADGNIHDEDDWGATPWSIAILDAFGRTSRLVHYDYSNHIGNSTSKGESEMRASVAGSISNFKQNTDVFFDDIKDLDAAIANFKKEGNKATADNPLLYICAGPMEVPYQCLNAVDVANRKYITLISHSNWNNNHTDGICKHTWTNMKALPGGAKFIDISDQNAKLGTSSAGKWDALKTMGPAFAWLFTRQAAKPGDVSDAGMMWYAMTNAQNGDPAQIIAKLKSPDAQLPALGQGSTSIAAGGKSGIGLRTETSGSALRIQLPFAGRYQSISLWDLSGHLVNTGKLSGTAGWFEIADVEMAKGAYFVIANGENGRSRAAGILRTGK